MGYRGTQNVSVHCYLYEVSVVPSGPFYEKTSTFSNEDLRKTLSQYFNVKWFWPNDSTNVGKVF